MRRLGRRAPGRPRPPRREHRSTVGTLVRGAYTEGGSEGEEQNGSDSFDLDSEVVVIWVSTSDSFVFRAELKSQYITDIHSIQVRGDILWIHDGRRMKSSFQDMGRTLGVFVVPWTPEFGASAFHAKTARDLKGDTLKGRTHSFREMAAKPHIRTNTRDTERTTERTAETDHDHDRWSRIWCCAASAPARSSPTARISTASETWRRSSRAFV